MKRVVKAGVIVLIVLMACLPVSWVYAEPLTVSLDQNRYKPRFDPQAYGRYQGVPIYMPSFTSRAENSGMNYYYGAKETVTYTGYPTLESYAWYCFEKALKSAGLKVYDYEAVKGMGEMRITILSLSAEEFVFAVVFYRAGLIELGYLEYRIVMPSLPAGKDAKALEENAYLMMDRAVTRILDDPSFEKTLRAVTN
ncbi:MAG: hypothetical protein CVU61_17495 [Deltaproteobacteria bacterium HGW-Deltaproteobacteria-19]|jgi:hypothetical protein|nr:MAG: hypothetical protein CVU61_17495 [Deltaproteobacteria bacterium HGW-Deltaproteobacteria-19]